MTNAIHIGIVGDFNAEFASHPATGAALEHAAQAVGMALEHVWVPTPSIAGEGSAALLAKFDGLWIAAGSPYRSMEGALRAIRFARQGGTPMAAT